MNMTTDERVAAEVRGAVAKHQERQAALADLLGMSQPSFSRRLAGKVPFTVGELQIIANRLGVPLSSFTETTAAAS